MQAHSEQNITPLPDSGGFMADMLQGVNSLTKGFAEYSNRCEMENRQLRSQLDAMTSPLPNIVAPDKQNEWIAVLYVLYEMGMICSDCSKKEFMQRMATALGSPGINEYSRQMYKFKETASKYDDLFKRIQAIAQEVKMRDNN